MRFNYQHTIQIIFLSQFALGLSACGGGSNTVSDVIDTLVEDVVEEEVTGAVDDAVIDNGDGMDAGSGGCVTFPRPQVGQIVKRELKDSDGDISITKSTEIMAISNTSITQKITGTGFGIALNSTNTEEYTIANNFRDITKETISQNTLGFNLETVTTYTPFQRVPVDQVCEGQTWTTAFTENEDDGSSNSRTQTYTIEAVNVSKTTAAGTFNTFRVNLEETSNTLDLVSTIWLDTVSGYDVLGKFSDTSGVAGGTLELVEKNF